MPIPSSTQDNSSISCHPELWMLPVPVCSFHIVLMICVTDVLQAGVEKILAKCLLEILQKMHEDSGIKTYHISHLLCRIYIEAPGITEIQELMKFSGYSHLVSWATCISDNIYHIFFAQYQHSQCSLPWVMGPSHTSWPLQG